MEARHRLRKRAEFERASRRGRRWGADVLALSAVRNDSGVTRCGFSVPRQVGNAVVRNAVRRRLREIVRRALPSLPPGWDLVLAARPAAAGASFAALAAAWSDLVRRAGLGPLASTPDGRDDHLAPRVGGA